MNTQRILSCATLGLILLSVLAACAPQPSLTSVAATIQRDCGPADGPAFTVSAPWDASGRIVISIWQSPEIAGRTQFRLTDPTDQTGSATLFTGADAWQPLSGAVSLDGVNLERPVRGEFRLKAASGEVYEAAFVAEWVDMPAFCG